MKHEVLARIAKAVNEVARERGGEGIINPSIERPKKPEHGDYATNVALAMAKRLGAKPIDLAQALKAKLDSDPFFARVDVAGPGFINVKLAPKAFHVALETILSQGRNYGRAPAATGERINLEFVSANPTGPLHMGHARSAVTGDAIARLLEARGHRVTREYYVNDFGNQVRLLAESVLARARGQEVPDGGYGAEYVTHMATWATAHAPKLVAAGDVEKLAPRLVAAMLAGFPGELGIKQTLRNLGIHFDVWASEGFLHQTGQVDRAIETLRGAGYLKEEDGALFFATTKVEEKKLDEAKVDEKKLDEKAVETKKGGGDDKDRVLKKRDGGHTYFASDIAYHKDKIDRGFDRLIDVWGADHHGYIPRVRAALRALELPAERFEVLLVQMVALLKNGEPYKMGKRLGNFITIDEVLDEIDEATGKKGSGRDALRYFFLARRADAQLDIDVDLAKKQSLENPVYYLQYGHARLCAIQRVAQAECGLDPEAIPESADAAGGVDASGASGATRASGGLSALAHPDELAMIALLGEFPDVLADAAAERAPHKLVAFLTTVAQTFQSYYTRLKNDNDTILPRKPERADGSWKQRDGGAYRDKVRARLAWVRAIRDVYGAGLGLLGIDAPTQMDRVALVANAASGEAGEAREAREARAEATLIHESKREATHDTTRREATDDET